MSEGFLKYKGFPLVRKGNMIYYGSMGDDYVTMLSISSTHKIKDMDVADKIKVTLMRTAQDIDPKDMIVKTSDRESLFDALDFANVWLTKALAQ